MSTIQEEIAARIEGLIKIGGENKMAAGYVLACKDIIAFMRANMLTSDCEADAVLKLSMFIDQKRKEIESRIAKGEL